MAASRLVLVAAVFVLLAVAAAQAGFSQLHGCGTDHVWQRHAAKRAVARGLPGATVTCQREGNCDKPAVRDAASWDPMTVRVVVHVFNSATGKAPNGVGLAQVTAQLATLNADYESYNIQFDLQDLLFHDDGSFYCIGAYGENGDEWYYQIEELKSTYAVDVGSVVNIFITCQDPSSQGSLLGIGTFPWDPSATTELGGLWLNSLATGDGMRTLSHEMGHTLGLWHTFHGVSEVSGCRDPCYEDVHSPFDSSADTVGDFCADTPATPLNYECASPPGADCTGVSWGDTAVNNIMSYSSDDCMSAFTEDQAARMHCWVCDALPGIVSEGCDGATADMAELSEAL